MNYAQIHIDGIDATARWGIRLMQSGANQLIAYPSIKSVKTNDWAEEDGVEADLDNPVYSVKESTIRFCCGGKGTRGNFAGFMKHLTASGYHSLTFSGLGFERRIWFKQMTEYERLGQCEIFSVKVADDFPTEYFNTSKPGSSVETTEDYLIDGIPFTDFGARVLNGSLAPFFDTATAKQCLSLTSESTDGAVTDTHRFNFATKEVKIKLLFRAGTLSELWNNHSALFHTLSRPGESEIYVHAIGQSFVGYYKSSEVTAFYPDGKIWLEMDLTFVLTGNSRLTDDIVLTDSALNVFVLPDGTAIDLQPKNI